MLKWSFVWSFIIFQMQISNTAYIFEALFDSGYRTLNTSKNTKLILSKRLPSENNLHFDCCRYIIQHLLHEIHTWFTFVGYRVDIYGPLIIKVVGMAKYRWVFMANRHIGWLCSLFAVPFINIVQYPVHVVLPGNLTTY